MGSVFETISKQLRQELSGLRELGVRYLIYVRCSYVVWCQLEINSTISFGDVPFKIKYLSIIN